MNAALQSYSDALTGLAQRLSEADRSARAAQLSRFLQSGFPGKRLEDWRYTDLAPLAAQSFSLADAQPGLPALEADYLPDCERLVFVNGHLDRARSAFDTTQVGHLGGGAEPLEPHADSLLALNRALSVDGLTLQVAAGRRLARPIQVLLMSAPGAAPDMSHLRHRIELQAGASATLLLQQIGIGSDAHFTTQTLSLALGAGAQLELVRVQDEGPATSQLFRCDATVAGGARLAIVNVDLGGGLVRNDWNVDLVAPQAQVALQGLYAPTGKAHVDNHTRIDHRAAQGTSRELFRGVVSGQARAVFNGKIVVHPDAQKTDSEQRVANLLLSKGAEVNAKPELEIYADDVKCAHGATFGQLDEHAIFYLRSRGIPAETARAMLTYTFAFEVLGRIEHPALRRHVERAFLQRLPQGLDPEGLL